MPSLVEGLQISDSFLVVTVSALVWDKSKMEENNFVFSASHISDQQLLPFEQHVRTPALLLYNGSHIWILIQIYRTLEVPLGNVCTEKSKHIIAHISLVKGKPSTNIEVFERKRLHASFPFCMFGCVYACQCLAFYCIFEVYLTTLPYMGN